MTTPDFDRRHDERTAPVDDAVRIRDERDRLRRELDAALSDLAGAQLDRHMLATELGVLRESSATSTMSFDTAHRLARWSVAPSAPGQVGPRVVAALLAELDARRAQVEALAEEHARELLVVTDERDAVLAESP